MNPGERSGTRARIVALLRRGRRTVEDLAGALGLTDNAVRAQLLTLQREGVAHATEVRRDGSVGKPAVLYDVVPSAEPSFSTAYAPLVAALLAELRERATPAELDALLRAAGRRVAEGLPPASGERAADARARAQAARDLLVSLGAEADLEIAGDRFVIRGYGCPLSAAVCETPAACAAVEELVGAVAGAPARERCDRGDPGERPRCRFEIDLPAA